MKQYSTRTYFLSIVAVLLHLHLLQAKSTFASANGAYKSQHTTSSSLPDSIQLDDVLTHLDQLELIALANNGNRAVGTSGFNATLDYLTKYLSDNTNFKITKTVFNIRDHTLKQNPILLSSTDGIVTNHTYSSDFSVAEFYRVRYSTSVNFSDYVPITLIPNSGCSNVDWLRADPPPTNRIALVQRGACTFIEQSELAVQFKVAALLIYNDGLSPDRMSPMSIHLAQNNTIPALSLSFELGERFARAARHTPNDVSARISIILNNDEWFPVANICADTPTGDPTQTIVIGSHSDGVRGGPGINDDGSGSAANLAWTVALSRLFETPAYEKYKYRLRFCWWAAEEIGILGSNFHVTQAKESTTVGERLSDYIVYLNFDMLGSKNIMFGTYDGRTAENDTLPSAITGSFKVSEAFRDWFIEQKLPWDFVDFGYGSDYAPFLIAGVPSGGLYSGSDEIVTEEECNRYNQLLGPDHCPMPNVERDPCYHEECDLVENINLFGYEKMIQAGASIIERFARKPDLKSWLISQE